MVDANRVKLMTRMASYEMNEGKKYKKIGNYFRSDYLAMQVIKSIVYGSIAYMLILAIYFIYTLDTFLKDIYDLDLILFAKDLLVKYAIFVLVYTVISIIVYAIRYSTARKSLRCYFNNLKKLSDYYTVLEEEK